MNKLELIDKAVDEWLHVGALVRVKANKQVLTVDRITEDNGVSCSNFKSYCRTELEPCGNGWINGYKYGVEYETNGKKPDLPDDVMVEVKVKLGEWGAAIPADRIAIDESSYSAVAFRIVDERYKPVEVEPAASVEGETPKKDLSDFSIHLSSIAHELIDAGEVDYAKRLTELSKEIANKQRQKLADEEKMNFVEVKQVQDDWYDYDKQQAIALPQVGVECEMVHPGISGYGWQIVTIENYFQSLDKENRVVVSNHNGDVWDEKYPVIRVDDELKFRPLDWNRKADEERAALVEVIKSCRSSTDVNLAEAILQAGFGKPKK